MENVSVILIDERDDYRMNLENFLTGQGMIVLGSFTHRQFMNVKELKVTPDMAIISFEVPRFHTELNVAYVQRRYPSVKILINSSDDSQTGVDKVIALGVGGLVFKNEKDFDQISLALDALHKGRTYFARR